MNPQWEVVEELQPTALKMLKNSIINSRLAHAYLFSGMRGTEKKATGLLLAMSVFCEDIIDKYKPCGQCVHCLRIINYNHPDVHIVEPDGLSIKKEQISNLQEEFSKTGLESNKKFYMIVHADKMTVNAANSLLKFLEEPHQQTVAVLITEQPRQILPTILSRCQTVSFHPLAPKILKRQLISKGVSPSQASLLIQLTNNIEDALQLNNDDWFAQAQKKVLKLYEVIKKDTLEALVFLEVEWLSHFIEKSQIDQGLDLLLLIYKDILNVQLEKDDNVVYIEWKETFKQEALRTTHMRLAEQMTAILEAKKKLQANVNPQLLMEQLVLNLQGGSSFV